jgi:hypothetical protein
MLWVYRRKGKQKQEGQIDVYHRLFIKNNLLTNEKKAYSIKG